MRSGRRDENDRGGEEERRGGKRRENLVPASNNLCQPRRRETGGDGVELRGGEKEGRQGGGERGAAVKRTGGKGAIEQEESVHAATGSSKESSQVCVGASAVVGELRASS